MTCQTFTHLDEIACQRVRFSSRKIAYNEVSSQFVECAVIKS